MFSSHPVFCGEGRLVCSLVTPCSVGKEGWCVLQSPCVLWGRKAGVFSSHLVFCGERKAGVFSSHSMFSGEGRWGGISSYPVFFGSVCPDNGHRGHSFWVTVR